MDSVPSPDSSWKRTKCPLAPTSHHQVASPRRMTRVRPVVDFAMCSSTLSSMCIAESVFVGLLFGLILPQRTDKKGESNVLNAVYYVVFVFWTGREATTGRADLLD